MAERSEGVFGGEEIIISVNMLKEFLINYLSSVLAGVTLGAIGLVVYKQYYLVQNNEVKQKNTKGQNVQQNIQTQNNYFKISEKDIDKITDTSEEESLDKYKVKY